MNGSGNNGYADPIDICGGGILKYQNAVYRVYDGGIAQIDENLQILDDTRLGSYNPSEIYSVKILDDKIYFLKVMPPAPVSKFASLTVA